MCVLLIRENQRRLEGNLKPDRTGGGFSNFLLFLFWFDPASVEAVPEHCRCYMLGPRIRVVVFANMFCRRLCHFTEPGFVSEGTSCGLNKAPAFDTIKHAVLAVP